jgi:hypothetical protein
MNGDLRRFLDFLRPCDGYVRHPIWGHAVAFIWRAGPGKGGTVIDTATGKAWFNGEQVARGVDDLRMLFAKRASRIAHGVDPGELQYFWFKRRERNAKRARRRAAIRISGRTGPTGVKPLAAAVEAPTGVTEAVKASAPAAPQDLMEAIRAMSRP